MKRVSGKATGGRDSEKFFEGSDAYLLKRATMDLEAQAEQLKWDRYYASLPLLEEDEVLRRSNIEFAKVVEELLPAGSSILEAGCGAGWQSLSLARLKKYRISLMDFSREALKYAKRIFKREKLEAEFIHGDVFTQGEPQYDLVFNAGVLEHYTFDKRVAFLKGMASRSRKYVIVLVPNQLCYWYWLWRIQKSGEGKWPFGKEKPVRDLSVVFKAAGLQFLGQMFIGESWTEAFISNLTGLDERLCQYILEIHRSPLIPKSQKSYLLAALGSVAAEASEAPAGWEDVSQPEEEEVAEIRAALSDALALRIGAEQQLEALRIQLAEKEQELQVVKGEAQQLAAEKGQVVQELERERQRLTEQLQTLQGQLAQRDQAVQELERERQRLTEQLAEKEQVCQALSERLSWRRYRLADRVAACYWRMRRPKRLVEFIGSWIWQLGRRWLPMPVKGWVKRVILRRPPPVWTPPESLPDQREVSVTLRAEDMQPLRASKYDVIILPIIDWDFRFQRSQQIAWQFARHGHRVFYLKTKFENRRSPDDCRPRTQKIREGIVEVQLPGAAELNVYRHQVDERTAQQWLRAFDHLRQDYGIGEAICLVQLPFWRPLAFQLRQRWGWRIVYDCMDKHSGFSTNEPAMLSEEAALSQGSDLVVATSRKLLEDQQRHNPRCVLVPNACDYHHFSVAMDAAPPALASMRRPIIGYYGAISEWFDVDLVSEIARLRPEWTFVLIGGTFGACVDPLRGLANVHLLGEQPYQALPGFLHAFDVCLIPFKLTPLTEATDPVKFYEYLSAGKPVVAVPLPELMRRDESVVSIARSAHEFVVEIERALREDSAERAAARRRFAQQNTWEERFERLRLAIQHAYERASIIVLTHNNLHLTKLCVESIFRNTQWPNIELIIVDNASTDGTREYLKELAQERENVEVIFNDRNEGFARANNQGILAATGEWIVLLNNDTIVTRGWLGRLIRYLEHDPKTGMVGPVTNSVGNEAKIDVSYSSVAEMEAFAQRRASEYEGRCFEIKMLALFCVVMRRKLFDEIGLLDERFEVGMFEDDDLALRARQAGYKLLCCEDVFVHHFHGGTFKQLPKDKYLQLFEANRKRFERKWGVRWEPHRYRGQP